MSSISLVEAHYRTTKTGIHEVVRRLNAHLGPTLVATLAGSSTRGAAHRWAKPASEGGQEPRAEAVKRLLAAHVAWLAIADAENEHVARAWFIGANPRLDNEAPVVALRNGEVKEVLDAAHAFVAGIDD